jgi:hypothetical protein
MLTNQMIVRETIHRLLHELQDRYPVTAEIPREEVFAWLDSRTTHWFANASLDRTAASACTVGGMVRPFVVHRPGKRNIRFATRKEAKAFMKRTSLYTRGDVYITKDGPRGDTSKATDEPGRQEG